MENRRPAIPLLKIALTAIAIAIAVGGAKIYCDVRNLKKYPVEARAVVLSAQRIHHPERVQYVRHRRIVHRAYTSVEIEYSYQVEGESYTGRFSTRSGTRRLPHTGDSITIVYAGNHPATSRIKFKNE